MAGKSLAEQHPELAKEWDSAKNGTLTPRDVTLGSGKKVWWKCDKGPDHEWDAIVGDRVRGNGCPVCRGFKVVLSNCLATLNPELAKQWHPTNNGELKPDEFTYGSGKKVWWLCQEGHSYDSVILNRTKKDKPSGCPYCSGQKVSDNTIFYSYSQRLQMNGIPPRMEIQNQKNLLMDLVRKYGGYDLRDILMIQ